MPDQEERIRLRLRLRLRSKFYSPPLSRGIFLFFLWNFCEAESNLKICPHYTNSLTFPTWSGLKTPLMNTRTIINKTVILSVFVIAGYLLARSLYYGSFIGVVLAIVAIGAWIMFLYQLNKLQAKEDEDVIEELPGSY